MFKNTHLQLNPGIHYGLVGANGSGKSTFIKILAGELTAESGAISISNGLQIGTLKQSHFLYENCLIRDVVMMGNEELWQTLQAKENLLQHHHFSENECEELSQLEKIIEKHQGYAAASAAAKLLEGLGISEKNHLEPMKILSGGYKLRVLLAQVLFSAPEVLLLDEPTNHLDLFSIKWLEGYLKQFPGMLLLSSHDRNFLDGVSDYIVDIDFQSLKIYKGNYTQFLHSKSLNLEQKEHLLTSQDRKKQHLQDFVDRFKAKASKATQAKSKMRMIEKIEDRMESNELSPSSRCYPNIAFEICRPSGAIPLTVRGIDKSYGTKKVLTGISFSLERGDRAAFVGANGIGKSTLLEILTGSLKADLGQYEWGFATYPAYFPQDHSREVTGSLSLLDWLGQFDQNATQEYLRNILGRVLFSGDDADKRVNVLSGGETARLILAKMMLIKHNVLIFDEPTNHLDMEATEALLEALENYTGTILVVSHNRYFISRLANRIIEMTHEGIHDFRGNYQEFIEWHERDLLSTEKLKEQKSQKESLGKLNYEEQKKQERTKKQVQRKIEQIESRCEKLECRLADINRLLCAEGFYQGTPSEEQKSLLDEKTRVENQLQQALKEWEEAHLTP